jgi:hypothetical protein
MRLEVKHGPPEGWTAEQGVRERALGRCRTFQVAEDAMTGSVS